MKKLRILAMIVAVVMAVTAFPLSVSARPDWVAQSIKLGSHYENYITYDRDDNTYKFTIPKKATVYVGYETSCPMTGIDMLNSKFNDIAPKSVKAWDGKLNIAELTVGAYATNVGSKTGISNGWVGYTLLAGTYYLQLSAYEHRGGSGKTISFTVTY